MVTKKKVKKPTLSSMKKKVWEVFKDYIRLRDCLFTTGTKEMGKCITCGVCLPREKLQAGHFIPGRHNANLFSEEDVHAQCWTCNYIRGGNPLEYRRQIIELYGDGYDEILEAEARQFKKFTVAELEALKAEFQEKIGRFES